MRTPKYITLITTLLAAIFVLPLGASAQKIKILGVSGGGTVGMIKAELADMPEGRTIKSVVTRRYQMSTSLDFPKADSYQLYGGKYILADLDYVEGDDYYYSLEVTLDDDTFLKTDMYNVGCTQGAVWADDIAKEFANATNSDADFTWFSNPRPWTGVNHTPVTPADAGRPLQIHRNSTYPHGMSLRATANGTQNATLNVQKRNEHGVDFTSVRFTFGLQAFNVSGGNSTGNGRVIFNVNGAETGWKGNMKAVTNAGNPYYFDATQANNPINTIGLQSNNGGVDNIAVLGALRLYYPVPASTKAAQSIVFETLGGKIMPDDPDIELSAYSTGDTPVFYTILQGSEIAELDGNVLRPMRDKTGEVVVEAFTFGNDHYGPASSTQTWSFNFGPTVDFLDIRDNGNGETYMYVYADADRKNVEQLTVTLYADHRVRNVARTITVGGSDLANCATHIPNVYALPLGNIGTTAPIYTLSYKFEGDPVVTGRLMEGREAVLYLDASHLNLGKGTYANASYNGNNGIQLGKGAYKSAVSLPVGSYMETKPAVINLSEFTRFAADVSGHKNASNLIEGNVSFALYNGTSQAYLNTGNIGFTDTRSWDFPLRAAENGKTVKVTCSGGFFGVGAVGSPRLYYKDDTGKESQTILMDNEVAISNFRPFQEPLQGRTSAGLPLFYNIKWGSEYATIVNDTILSVHKLPSADAQIVIEAYSPGNKYYLPAEVAQCTYHLTPALIIPKDAVVELEGGSHVGDMVIYGDARSCGQAVVKDGVVNVEKLTLRYTFVPGEWTNIAFPADLDISNISNLAAKGFTYSTEEGINNTYLLRAYDTEVRATDPDADPWVAPTMPHVEGLKGYLMKLESADKTPVEVAFTMHNMSLDFHNKLQAVNLTVDLSKCEPGSRHSVYVRPTNVKGNTLKVDVRYVPTEDYTMHINHARALESMRVTFAQDHSSIRLTLPDQTPARVIFYDKKGKKVQKAVNYVSPMRIDISDMKPGKYRMVVLYGPAAIERVVEL